MRITRRREVTVETAHVTVLHRGVKAVQAWCRECCEQVRMVPLEEVMVLTGASSRLIHRLIEAGRIHFQEVPDALPFICLDSLLDFSREGGSSDERIEAMRLNTQKDDYGLHLQKVNDTEPIEEKMR